MTRLSLRLGLGLSLGLIAACGRAPTLSTVWGSGADDVWVGGGNGSLIHWDGQRWEKKTEQPGRLGGNAEYSFIWGTDAQHVWLASSVGIAYWDGAAYRDPALTPSGAPFVVEPRSRLSGMSGRDLQSVFAVGGYSQVLKWNPTTEQFSGWTLSGQSFLSRVWVSAQDTGVTGSREVIRLAGSAGPSQSLGVLPETPEAIWGSSASDIWVGGRAGFLAHWNGSDWQRIDVSGLVNNIPQPAPSFSFAAG